MAEGPQPGRAGQIIRVIGLLVLLAVLIGRVDAGAVQGAFRGMSAWRAAASAACFCVAMALRLRKWNLQVEALGLPFDRWVQARNFLMGILIGVVTPMRAGELYRLSALDLSDTPAEPLGRRWLAMAALLLEKGYELLILLGLVVAGGWMVLPVAWPSALLAPVWLGGMWFGLGDLRPPGWAPDRLKRLLAPVIEARRRMSRGRRLAVFGLTATAQGLNMAGSFQIYRAFGDLDPLLFCFGGPLLTLTTLLPISISGIGVRELAAMEVFGRTGFPSDAAAVAASLSFFCANVLPCAALLPLALRGLLKASGAPPH